MNNEFLLYFTFTIYLQQEGISTHSTKCAGLGSEEKEIQ